MQCGVALVRQEAWKGFTREQGRALYEQHPAMAVVVMLPGDDRLN